jgi:hypothetical protein
LEMKASRSPDEIIKVHRALTVFLRAHMYETAEFYLATPEGRDDATGRSIAMHRLFNWIRSVLKEEHQRKLLKFPSEHGSDLTPREAFRDALSVISSLKRPRAEAAATIGPS